MIDTPVQIPGSDPAGLTLAAAVGSTTVSETSLLILAGWYACASLACFIAYALDKRAARTGRRRTPERTLLLLGLAGGWPGGWLAQRVVRHKSSKASFQAKFRVTVIGNIAIVLLLLKWGLSLMPLR